MLSTITSFNSWRSVSKSKNTITSYDKDLRYFTLFCRNKNIEEVTEEDITQYILLSKTLGWSDNSIRLKAVAIRELFQYATNKGQKCVSPKLVALPNHEVKPPKAATIEDYHALLEAIEAEPKRTLRIRNKAIVMTLYATGCRVGELVSLNVESLVLDENKALVLTEKTKGERHRELFLDDRTTEALSDWLQVRECNDPALFITRRFKRMGRISIRQMIHVYCERANIRKINCHEFRHFFALDCVKNGLNNSAISSLLGHINIQSSFVYTRLRDKSLQKAHELVR